MRLVCRGHFVVPFVIGAVLRHRDKAAPGQGEGDQAHRLSALLKQGDGLVVAYRVGRAAAGVVQLVARAALRMTPVTGPGSLIVV